jgi:hypothetical protein
VCILVSGDFVVAADLDMQMGKDRAPDRTPKLPTNLYMRSEIHHNMHTNGLMDRRCIRLIGLYIVTYPSLFVLNTIRHCTLHHSMKAILVYHNVADLLRQNEMTQK